MKNIIALSCAAILSFGTAAALADDIGMDETADLVAQGKIKSMETLEERALSVRPGTITKRDLERDDGRYVYKLEIRQDDGTDWEVKVDAVTEAVLENEQED